MYLDRAIVGHPFAQKIVLYNPSLKLKAPSLDWMYPAHHTLEWWKKTLPEELFSWWPNGNDTPRGSLTYDLKRAVWRLMVELFDRLRAGDWVMKGHRTDKSYLFEEVEPGWWSNPFMAWRPRVSGGGWFHPEKWHGSQPPLGLPSYQELTLWPAEVAGTKQPLVVVTEGGTPPPPRRPPQSRFSFDESDAPLVAEIVAGVKSRRFRSVWQGGVEMAPNTTLALSG